TTIVSPSVNSTYSVSATDANGCIGTATTSVSIVNSLTVTALATNSISCSGSLDTLIASGAQSYTWTASNGSTTSISVNNATVTANPTTMTTYTVKGMSGACSDSATVTINIAPPISITVTANPANATICMGDNITLSGNGALTYTWTGGITDGTAFSPTSSQTYTVTGTNAQGCTGMATQSVTVNPLPIVNINASSSAICAGQSATLTATGATTYAWSTTDMTPAITVSPNSTQSYTVIGTDGNNCTNVNAPAVVTVTVNPLPTVTIASNPASSAVCAGSSATLTASGAQTYTWDSGSNVNPLSVSPSTQTTYTVIGTDANNCFNAATITINVNPLPVAQTVTGNTFVCIGVMNAPTVLSAANPGTWTGPAPLTTTISANSTTANITQGGVYTLNTINSCGDATTTYTVVADSVKANFTASPLTGQMPLTVTYTNTSQGNSLSYNWAFGDGNNSLSTNPTNIFTAAGNYQTLLTATDNLGCKDTATIDIVVNLVPSVIVIPNIFTPNQDGINDIFSVNATGINNFDCKVYDRWGLLLHEWAGTDGGWDGKAKNGSNCTDGTYYYLITYTDNLNKSTVKDGFFQLIR
ncbi:MAG TPA: gliding motility-associated C-terminal domain-containing protein, partial [Bacteroidia bacterium]|nr:gliding motility-associated C-terminal domain-containing protein [Bacteroidia bacterium]